VRLLLDTHVFLWWLNDDPKLNEAARAAISAPTAKVWISAATIWEASIKKEVGKLQINRGDLVEEISANGFIELPISARHASVSAELPKHHKDPFDRMLIAQAQVEELILVTRDSVLKDYDVQILPA
jgi:PIN domain nuclease of toxin-antitoxin system